VIDKIFLFIIFYRSDIMIKVPGPDDLRKNAMLDKEFLESYPLYKSFVLTRFSRLDAFRYSPSVVKNCPTCKSDQTFTFSDFDESSWMTRSSGRAGTSLDEIYKDITLKINYECKGCHSFQMNFMLKFSSDGKKVQKIGQYPPVTVNPSQEINVFLGEYVDLFKKGIVCESQSYGIAAFSYYRRIVELEIERLLGEVRGQVDPENAESFDAAFDEIKKSHYAKDKIDLISKIIPSRLKPGGVNPMGILYKALSEGLHSLSDEECLENATAVRQTLESFIHLLNANKDAVAKLSKATKQLLSAKRDIKE
jgi:hypothetical protein